MRAACEREAAPGDGVAVGDLLPRLGGGIAAVVVLLECWVDCVALLLCFFWFGSVVCLNAEYKKVAASRLRQSVVVKLS